MQLLTDPEHIIKGGGNGNGRLSCLYCIVCIQAAFTTLFTYTKQRIHGK